MSNRSRLPLLLALILVLGACGGEPTPQVCVEADDLSSCGCSAPDDTGYYLDPGYHYTSSCSPATLAPATDVGCCAMGRYPAKDDCLCRPNQPPDSCALVGGAPVEPAPRFVSSCAINGVLSSQ